MRGVRWAPALAAAGVFALLLFRPFDIARLRGRMRRDQPQAWDALPTNGRFHLLVPQLISYRYHDEAFYASSVREIFKHGRPYDPYWREGVGSWIQGSLALGLLAAAAAPFHGDMNRAWIATVAVLGVAWFFLFHQVFYWWSGKDEVAVPLALFSVLFPDLYSWLLDVNLHVADNVDRYRHVFFQHFAELRPHFDRLPYPFLSQFLLCLLLLGLWSLSVAPRRRPVAAVPLGAAFGLMMWVHPLTFLFGMSTMLALTAFVSLRPSPTEQRWNIALAFLAALPVGFFCLRALSHGISPEAWQDHIKIMGGHWTRRPFPMSAIHLIFAGFGWWAMNRETDLRRGAAWRLLICAQIGIFLCRNLQVVTGYYVQPFHYIPMGSFMGCLMLFLYGSGRLAAVPRWNRAAGAVLSAVILFCALGNEKAAAENTYRLFGLPRATEAALDWVNEKLPPDALVLSLSAPTNESLPLYTSAQGYVSTLELFRAPFTEERYTEKVARLLKTVHADPDRFIAERWPLPSVRAPLAAREDHSQRVLGAVDPATLERLEWFNSYDPDLMNDASTLRRQEEFKKLVEKADVIPAPYYLWVNAADAALLRRSPESYGGERVYRGEGVDIYRFAGATGGSHG